MATKKGTLVLIKVASKTLVGQNSLSYNDTVTMIEVSSKTSGNYSEFVSGRIAETLSVSGIAATNKEATKAGYWELKDAVTSGATVQVTFTEYTEENGTSQVTGAEKITVNAYVSNLTWEAPDNDAITFSADFQITGAPVRETNVASGTPIADAGPNQTVNEGATVTLDATASTNGGSGTLTYLWTPPAGITLSSNTIAQPTFTAPSQTTYAEYEFTLQVYNETLYSLTDKVVITVVNVP
jgi:hypothetical protein